MVFQYQARLLLQANTQNRDSFIKSMDISLRSYIFAHVYILVVVNLKHLKHKLAVER